MTKSNIFKKIAAGVLAFTMLIGAVPAMAEESADTQAATAEVSLLKDHELELLMKLNIVTEAMSELKSKEMPRGVFSEMLTAMLGLGGGDNAIEELYNLGIVNGYGNGNLKEHQTITYYEAIKMVVCALGYATVAEANGGYPLGYVKVAYDCDLISGSVENNNLTYEQGMKLMLDAGNCNMATVSNDYYLSGIELGGDTMFYTYFDVVRIEGILSANGYTSLDGKDCILGEVIIGGNNIEVGGTNAADLIGYYVEAYCYDKDVIDEVVVAAPYDKYTKEVSVFAGAYVNATGTLRNFQVEYEKEDGKKAKINVADYYVIKNGKLYGGLTLDELNASLADVTFIDNDRDNVYEIVKLEQYETYMVESVNNAKYEVYAKYDKTLVLDPDNQDVFIYKATGALGEFKDIAPGMALSVLKSQDGSLVKVYILPVGISGKIEGKSRANNHDVLTIGGKQYVVTYEYAQNTHADKIEPIVGSSVKIYLDLKGNIVEMELKSGVWTYGYIMRVTYDENEERCSILSIYSQANKRVDLNLGDKVEVDGIRYSISELGNPGVEIIDFTGSYPKANRQLVRYRETDGKLTHLDTWTTYNSSLEEEGALGSTKDTDIAENGEGLTPVTGQYNSTLKFFLPYDSASGDLLDKNMIVGADGASICFAVPTEENANDERMYTAGGMNFGDGSSYSIGGAVFAYNLNEANIAKVFVRDSASKGHPDTSCDYIFLTDLSVVVNGNGEPAYHVEGISIRTGNEYSKTAAVDNTLSDDKYRPVNFFPGKGFGDIFVYVNKNVAGEGSVLFSALEYTDVLNGNYGRMNGASYVSMRSNSAGINSKTYLAKQNEYVGEIGWADRTHMRLEAFEMNTTDPANPVRESFTFALEGAKIYLVDMEAETIEAMNVTEVAGYAKDKIGEGNSKVYVLQRDGAVASILIYTNFN